MTGKHALGGGFSAAAMFLLSSIAVRPTYAAHPSIAYVLPAPRIGGNVSPFLPSADYDTWAQCADGKSMPDKGAGSCDQHGGIVGWARQRHGWTHQASPAEQQGDIDALRSERLDIRGAAPMSVTHFHTQNVNGRKYQVPDGYVFDPSSNGFKAVKPANKAVARPRHHNKKRKRK